VGDVPAVELITVGQRKGLGGSGGAPTRYVVDVDVPARRVTVGSRADLLVGALTVKEWRWVEGATPGHVLVQVSAHGRPRAAALEPAGEDGVTVRWTQPERRVAPGQSVVAYDPTDTFVLGGGVAV